MKKEVFEEYRKNLNSVEEINFQKVSKNTTHSNWMFGIRFPNFSLQDKRDLELSLFEFDIDSRPMFYDINKHQFLSNIKNNSTNSEILQRQCLILPSYPELTKGQIIYVCEKIKKFIINKK
jgi:dTDP-4-amino-4,6-dideoxygalactose transaminase